MKTIIITCDWCGKEITGNENLFLSISNQRGEIVHNMGKTVPPYLNRREICLKCANEIFEKMTKGEQK